MGEREVNFVLSWVWGIGKWFLEWFSVYDMCSKIWVWVGRDIE